jgi:hypothetical protein
MIKTLIMIIRTVVTWGVTALPLPLKKEFHPGIEVKAKDGRGLD